MRSRAQLGPTRWTVMVVAVALGIASEIEPAAAEGSWDWIPCPSPHFYPNTPIHRRFHVPEAVTGNDIVFVPDKMTFLRDVAIGRSWYGPSPIAQVVDGKKYEWVGAEVLYECKIYEIGGIFIQVDDWVSFRGTAVRVTNGMGVDDDDCYDAGFRPQAPRKARLLRVARPARAVANPVAAGSCEEHFNGSGYNGGGGWSGQLECWEVWLVGWDDYGNYYEVYTGYDICFMSGLVT